MVGRGMGEDCSGNHQSVEAAECEPAERALAQEIGALWSAQRNQAAAVRRTRAELKTLRRDLGQRLHQMKSLLVQTGRGGSWSGYLREHRIPRATADRLVQRHEQALVPVGENRLNEAIPTSIEQEIEAFFQKLRPRLLKVLTTQEAAFDFVCKLVCGLPGVDGDVTDDAALIFRPGKSSFSEASAAATEPVLHIEVE
jgi:hypothetical protein